MWLFVVVASTALAETPPSDTSLPPDAPPLSGPDPNAGSLISLRITGGFMPYRLVSYEVLWRRRVAVASHYRSFVNVDEALHDMKLLQTVEFEALLDALEKEDEIFTLPPEPTGGRSVGSQRFELEVRRGDRKAVIKVSEPDGLADPRYARAIARIRSAVVGVVGELPFRNAFFDAGAFGFLNLTTVPVTRLYVDGRDTGLETPVYGLELSQGPHTLKVVSVDPNAKGWEREHSIRVDPGMTTILHLDLR